MTTDERPPARPSTALATRSPQALRTPPEFFPEGHRGRDLAIVLLAAPLAASALVMAVVMALGMPTAGAMLLGLLATPFAMKFSHDRLSKRGASELDEARAIEASDPQRGIWALENVAHSSALPEVRLEAAARIAVAHLERGDVAAAIEALSLQEPDANVPRRRRNWKHGLRAEALRSILAWLAPSSFTESGVASSQAFPATDDPDGQALLAALRLLEAASEPDEGALVQAWRSVRASMLSQLFPMLFGIVLAVAAERLEHLQAPLHDRLQHDDAEQLRATLRRLFPRMVLFDEGGYRQAVADDIPPEGPRALAVAAPSNLTALAQLEMRDLAPVSRFEAAKSFAKTYAVMFTAGAVLGALSANLGAAIAMGIVLTLYVGTPLGAIAASRRTQKVERARRVAPLTRLQPPPPTPWLNECASGPPGAVTRSSGFRRLLDIPPDTMVLYVAVARAEQALALGNIDGAWSEVEWWFLGFSGKIGNADPMYSTGSSLVRVAALSGHVVDARRLAAVLPERSSAWDGPRNRTMWGSAPRATALARALVAAIDRSWLAASEHLESAQRAGSVFMHPHDHALAHEICSRANSYGSTASWNAPPASEAARAWVTQVWPEQQPDK